MISWNEQVSNLAVIVSFILQGVIACQENNMSLKLIKLIVVTINILTSNTFKHLKNTITGIGKFQYALKNIRRNADFLVLITG